MEERFDIRNRCIVRINGSSFEGNGKVRNLATGQLVDVVGSDLPQGSLSDGDAFYVGDYTYLEIPYILSNNRDFSIVILTSPTSSYVVEPDVFKNTRMFGTPSRAIFEPYNKDSYALNLSVQGANSNPFSPAIFLCTNSDGTYRPAYANIENPIQNGSTIGMFYSQGQGYLWSFDSSSRIPLGGTENYQHVKGLRIGDNDEAPYRCPYDYIEIQVYNYLLTHEEYLDIVNSR